MAMQKECASKSVATSFWFVLGVMILVLSSQFSFVHSRVLRSAADSVVVVAESEQLGGSDSAGVMAAASFVVSSSIRSTVRSLGFKLASGPSKRGPGH